MAKIAFYWNISMKLNIILKTIFYFSFSFFFKSVIMILYSHPVSCGRRINIAGKCIGLNTNERKEKSAGEREKARIVACVCNCVFRAQK